VLAVLPFTNRSGLKVDDIFAFGMAGDIIDALSLSRTIRMLSSGATAADGGTSQILRMRCTCAL
jgi:TolB-like protein